MKKADIIKALIKKHGLAVRQATEVLQTCLDEIITGLKKGETVELRRFGVFKTKKQKPRTIVHPETGKPIQRPAQTIVLFEASSAVKTVINQTRHKRKRL